MQVSSLLDDTELKKYQEELYNYFESGYAFEEFLKKYLLKMGLDEVEVTRRSRDGGIDLKAIRKGIGDFSEIDITHYHIQAKRYSPSRKIGVEKIRELRGVLPLGYKGMLITTSEFTSEAELTAKSDESRPVVAIDGRDLVVSCIDNEIGFLFKPFFSKSRMDYFLGKGEKSEGEEVIQEQQEDVDYVEKLITKNDIRSRIISIPTSIIMKIPEEMMEIEVNVNNEKAYKLSVVRGRNYFGGVTQLLKDYGLILDDGVLNPKNCKWRFDKDNCSVKLSIFEE